MNKQTISFVIIAVLVGGIFGYTIGKNCIENESLSMHKMPDGSMMMNHDTSMKGMMMDMNANLVGKTGDAFDKAFLSEMIVHHEGAVDMAKLVLTSSKRKEMIDLANAIITAQTKEIAQMKEWLATWFK
jgi:uncharacterized protein (DUF305 family)